MKTKMTSRTFFACMAVGATLGLVQGALAQTSTNEVASALLGAEYTLGPSDIISIEVFQEPTLTVEQLRIQPDGKVKYHLLGEVEIGGLSPSEASDKIKTLLAKDYIRDPHVILQVVQYNDRKVSVLGSVNNPSIVNMPPGQKWTIMEAITAAGGFNRYANKNKIKLIRPGEKERRFKEDELREMAYTNDPDKIVHLQPGDQIYVEESAW